ncbi:MAG: IS66 family transposase [Actinobacteria bacterium]|nr:IS66 family transposase [Actinomycetota bacterium]
MQQAFSALQAENRLLQQKLQALLQRYFGNQKNEAIDPAQLAFKMAGLEEPVILAPAPQAKPAKSLSEPARKPVRQVLPSHLPLEEVILEPSEVREDARGWTKIGEEKTEELDYKPGGFLRRVFVRPKYAKADQVVIAELPARLIDKGLPGAGLLAQVYVSKYDEHTPLYRQQKIYQERHGVHIPRQTLSDWVERGAHWLLSIQAEMKKQLLAGGYLQVDETPIKYLDPDVAGHSETGYLWAYSSPAGDVIFDWHISRGREGPEKFLKGFKGLLQTDGYGVYDSLARERPDWVLFGCMAHCRRKFVEALEEDRRASWFVRQIALLYMIEKALRTQKAGPALREAMRQSESQMVLSRMQKALERLRPKVLPKSQLGEAISYALNQWENLCRFVKHGRVEIDNNLVENAIRPTALGKKNFLFIGHPQAGWKSAVIYSIIGSCRRHEVNPYDYLKDVFERLPNMKASQVPELTPQAWAKTRQRRQ